MCSIYWLFDYNGYFPYKINLLRESEESSGLGFCFNVVLIYITFKSLNTLGTWSLTVDSPFVFGDTFYVICHHILTWNSLESCLEWKLYDKHNAINATTTIPIFQQLYCNGANYHVLRFELSSLCRVSYHIDKHGAKKIDQT